MSVLHDLVFGGPTVVMVWGPFAESEGTVLGEIAATYNLAQVIMYYEFVLRKYRDYVKYRLCQKKNHT